MATTAVIDLTRFALRTDVLTRIKTSTTLYLSPSGNDTTGDGSSGNPWFSIKKAVEYLDDYRIDPDVVVTIRGLAGTYNYNDAHKVLLDHPDISRIQIHFDYVNGSTTYNNGSNFNSSPDGSGGYRISLGVYSTTGFETGQYVKISSNTYDTPSLYNGYFKLYAVNHGSNIITIEYNGYNNVHSEIGNVGNNNLFIRRMETHINTSISSGQFIWIKGDILSFILFASNSNSTNYSHDFISLLNTHTQVSVNMLCLNGYNRGLYARGSDVTFSIFERSRFTNCRYGIFADKGTHLELSGVWASLNNVGVLLTTGSLGYNELGRFGVVNNIYGLYIAHSSGYISKFNDTGSITALGNNAGIYCYGNSIALLNIVARYNTIGIDVNINSYVHTNYGDNYISYIDFNTYYGIICANSSIDITSTKITYNDGGIYAKTGSIINTNDSIGITDTDLVYNNKSGIYHVGGETDLSYVQANLNGSSGLNYVSCIVHLRHTQCNNNAFTNTQPGLLFHSGCISNIYFSDFNANNFYGVSSGWGGSLTMFDCTCNYNDVGGLFIAVSSSLAFMASSCIGNTGNGDSGNGIYVTNTSNASLYGWNDPPQPCIIKDNVNHGLHYKYNSSGSIRLYTSVYNNQGHDMYVTYGSSVSDTSNTGITHTLPTPNTAPSYNGGEFGGCYITR